MKTLAYRISLILIVIMVATIYGLILIVDPFHFRSHHNWSILKWTGTGFLIGLAALFFEGSIELFLKPFIGNDRVVDPLWKRSILAIGVIAIFSSAIIALAFVNI